ncbi:probable LRR receptor-like serine/threonine-protein kinase At3g47570 [Neltuma alba]|uniref:probable LRR receptor-like serine/threonine-protein kinase At3g47570 n=1 Tax=Neltuma alba TaxID=207710 RepID=UPI0010A54C05|nr:probable LRR receptor-like serine/threonine-protein kinase At3g47570 [Prosopis alba]
MASASIISFSFLSKYYLQPLILIIFICINLLCFQHVGAASNETDYLALLQFKESITDDPHEILSSWNSSNNFCSWIGITCGHKHRRVTVLNLGGYHLGGIISPHIGNLSFLRYLSLTNNSFHGEIPPELGRLFRLNTLLLSNNSLTGEIPLNLTNCNELRILHLLGNSLTGTITSQVGALQKLQKLQLALNNLTGEIPLSLQNLTSLTYLALGRNNFEGSIPEEIGHLKNLVFFGAAENSLSGALPSSLYNLSSLTMISVAANHLNGTRLPNHLFSSLNNLKYFAIGSNQISGLIPNSITNASSLQIFDISYNNFLGEVPNLGNLKDLRMLNLAYNNIGSNRGLDFITTLKNCSQLEVLALTSNIFGGILPSSMGNLSTQLTGLYLSLNQISGTIPDTLGRYTLLRTLDLSRNEFSGTIPTSFGNLGKIKSLYLGANQLSGEITFLGNLSELIILSIPGNKLEGKIPTTIGNMKSLQLLELTKNSFSGPIPIQIFGLSSLSIFLDISQNSLNGSLPSEVGMLKNLGILDISYNNFSGEIPLTIGECESMEYLNLQGNSFKGPMPPSVALMKGLTHLDISRNNLSGSILINLENISSLQYFNASFNMFVGEVPTKGVFSNASAISVIGNINLCGGISELHLPTCPKKLDTQRKHNLKLKVVIVIGVSTSLLLIFLFAFYWRHERNKKSSSTSLTIEQFPKVSYQHLHIVTEGFSTNNLIGSGSHGLVYKGKLELEDKVVAIKVLNLQKKGAQKSFISECNALKNMRHRNLVRILTCCSSIDYKGQEFKALVFEYMSNGSLEKWLHPNQESADRLTLDISQRLSVIYDVASALHYLHYENEQSVVHCDLKPSNVLLDDDMVAHVSDFGLARLLATLHGSPQKETSTSGLKGTIGYAPPEYGMSSEVSTQGDMYSFGILILEMLTGKRPTDPMFGDGHNLHSYINATFPNNLLEIVDKALVPQQIQQTATGIGGEIRIEEGAHMHPNHERTLILLFEIGLACSVQPPKERMNMMGVLRELNQVKNAFGLGERRRN